MKMRTIGSGFETINIPVIKTPNSDEFEGYSYAIPPETNEKVMKIIENIKIYRGEVISGCVDIDHLLGESISRFFLKNNPEKREIFHELIIDTTFFSISQKKNILQLIMEKHPEEFRAFSPKERQKFFVDLNYIIKIRNALAHGDVKIDYNADRVFLQYYNSQKNRIEDVDLDQDFFDGVRNKISTLVSNFLNGVSLDPSTVLERSMSRK